MTKYRHYFEKMLDENEKLFHEFRQLHDKYALDQDTMQEEFNTKGRKVMSVIRDYENKLCKNSEKTYSMFTGNLAEKFWAEVRKSFPMIDHIGIIANKPGFTIRKISLK